MLEPFVDGRQNSRQLLEFMTNLECPGIQVKITTDPVEVDNGIPFSSDRVHADYDPCT
jgi:hypothetical protein